jgi:hypothetical protein
MHFRSLYERITNPARTENDVGLELPNGDESALRLLVALGFVARRDGTRDYAVLTKRIAVTDSGFSVKLSHREHRSLVVAFGIAHSARKRDPAAGSRAPKASPKSPPLTVSVVIDERQPCKRPAKAVLTG